MESQGFEMYVLSVLFGCKKQLNNLHIFWGKVLTELFAMTESFASSLADWSVARLHMASTCFFGHWCTAGAWAEVRSQGHGNILAVRDTG